MPYQGGSSTTKLQQYFANLDKDSNGQLSRPEFEVILKTLDSGKNESSAIMTAVYNEVWDDVSFTDKNGQARIEFEDLRMWLRSVENPGTHAAIDNRNCSSSGTGVVPTASSSKLISWNNIQLAIGKEKAKQILDEASASANAHKERMKNAEKRPTRGCSVG